MATEAERIMQTQRAIVSTIDRISLSIANVDTSQDIRLQNLESVTLRLVKAVDALSQAITQLEQQQEKLTDALLNLADLHLNTFASEPAHDRETL